MLSYCLKCKKNTESKTSRVSKASTWKIMVSPNSAVGNKKKRFIKEQEVR